MGPDLGEDVGEGLLVEGIAGEDLIGQRKTVWGDNRGDHHLDTIGALIPAVTEGALAMLRWLARKIGTAQIVLQEVEAGIEEAAPTLLQGGEQRLFVLHQTIRTAVEGVAVGDGKVLAEQVTPATAVEPVTVPAPLAAGVDRTVGDQGLEYIQPAGALAAGRQPRLPESVQSQQLSQPTRQPARAPLPRTAQLQSAQLALDHRAGQLGRQAVLCKQGHLRGRALVFVKHLERAPPGGPLDVVDVIQVPQAPLHHPPVRHAPVLHHAPAAVFFAV